MPEPIRILHIITRMVKGGAQENTLATVRGINEPGIESSLAAGPAVGPEGSLEPECLQAGVRMLRVPELTREIAPRADLLAVRRLTALCRKERPHIVHTHTSKAGIVGRIAARRAGVPVVVHTPHGHVFHSYGGRLKTRAFVAIEQFTAKYADRLVALTATEQREHVELGIGSPDQWSIVHSGINFTGFERDPVEGEHLRREIGIAPEATVIGTVGRLVPVKGQRHLIEAFARVKAARPHSELVIIGDGELREELLALARARQLEVRAAWEEGGLETKRKRPSPGGTVHFLGLRRDVSRLLNVMDIFALPSLNEGMGRVLVEAMAMNLPCVASHVSGVPDVVRDGRTGLLVPPADPDQLAEALLALVNDPERARTMGEHGRACVVPAMSEAVMLEKLRGLYQELLAEKGFRLPPRGPSDPQWPLEGVLLPAGRG